MARCAAVQRLRQALHLLSTPPWRTAPIRLASSPGVLAAVTITGLVLGFTVASRPILIAGAAAAAQASAIEDGCPFLVGLKVGRPAVFGLERRGLPTMESVGNALDAAVEPVRPLGQRVVTVFVGSAGVGQGRTATPVQVIARTGFEDHVDVVASSPSARAGAWVPDTLGLGIDDELQITINGRSQVLPVSAVIRDLAAERDEFWCSLSRQFEPFGAFQPPPVLLVDPALLGDIAGPEHPARWDVWWEYPPPADGWELAEVRAVIPALERIADSLNDRTSELHTATGGGSSSVDVTGVLGQADRAAGVVDAAGAPVVAGAAAAAVLTLLGVAPIWTQRRAREIRLLRMRGAGPVLLSIKALAELGAPFVAGTLVGFAAAVLIVPKLGVLAPAATTTSTAFRSTAVVCAAALVLLTPLLLSALRERRRREVAHLPLWEVVVLAVAAASLYELRKRDSSIVAGSEVDFLVVVFPAVLLLGVSGLVARAFSSRIILGRLVSSAPASLWLAGRRLGAHRGRFVLALTCASVATGAVVFALGLSSSIAATGRATVLLPHGAEEVVELHSNLDRERLPSSDARAVTVVERATETGVQARGRPALDVLGVRPETFEGGAFWDRSFSDSSLGDLLRVVATGSETEPVVLIAGMDAAPGSVVLTLPGEDGEVEISAAVAADAEAFPGMGHRASGRPLAVIDARVLDAAGVRTTPYVWADEGALDDIDLPAADVRSEVRPLERSASLALEAHTTAVRYVAAVGVTAGLVTLAGVGLYLGANRRDRRVGDAVAGAVGASRRLRWAALYVELVALLAGGAIIGSATAVAALRLIKAHLDPLPLAPPEPILRLHPAVLLGAVGFAVISAALVAVIAQWLARRHPLPEMLRGG